MIMCVASLEKVQAKAENGVRKLDAALACRAAGCSWVGATTDVLNRKVFLFTMRV